MALAVVPAFSGAQELPAKPDPPRLVNDFAGLFSEQERGRLESKLVAFNDSTSTQIAVVTLTSLDGYPIDDYAFKLGEAWGIGRQGKNNGALVLVAKNDRKVFIATGYGLEGAIPDALAKRIVETQVVPAFREGAYYRGVDEAVNTMIGLASGEYSAEDVRKEKKPSVWLPIVFFILMMAFVFFNAIRRAKRYAAVNGVDLFTAWMLINAARRSRSGRWGGFSGGGFGGGGGGGGFGGFGGGSFGGGGAGGSW